MIDALSAKIGGGITYLQQMLPQLDRAAGRHEIRIVLSPRYQAALIAGTPKGISVEEVDLAGDALLKRWWYQQTLLPRILRSRRMDLLFGVSEAAYSRVPARLVVLARNRSIYVGLGDSGAGRWASARHRLLRQPGVFVSLQRADRVVFVSATFRDEVVRQMHLDRAKTRVVHHGVSEQFSVPASVKPTTAERPYVLAVSNISPHKNYETVLRAFALLNSPGLELWIAGRAADASTYEGLRRIVRELRMEDRVRFLGEVAYDDLPRLYRGATAFVLASLLETFGHPLVEAMASGAPVIASDLPVAREICEDAALFFSPASAEELKSRIQAVIADPELKASMSARGMRRAESFSWQKSATELLAVFEELES